MIGIEPILRSLKEILLLNNTELQKQGLLLFTEILKRQPVEIKLFANNALFRDAINVLLEAVHSPVLEVAGEGMKAVAAILRRDHVNLPPIEYGELQKLVEGVLKRCSDLSLAPFNRRFMVSNSLFFFILILWNARMILWLRRMPLLLPIRKKKDTLKSFSEFLMRMCDSLCIPIVMKYSERAVRPALMEVFISTLSILFSIMPHICKNFSIKLGKKEYSPHFFHMNMTKCLPQLNFSVLESLSLLSETTDSCSLDETLRNHQYSLLLLFYIAFSQEDRFVPEVELFSAIRSFLLSVQDQGDCPPPYVFKAVLYLLASSQDKNETLDLLLFCKIVK
uniref:Uncharacterized protein n=1 Tax=Anolis carolinensis TaxID=28377 RepID=G1KCU6_ANOCA